MAYSIGATSRRFIGIILILGSVVFMASGAFIPKDPKGDFLYTQPVKDQLVTIASNADSWRWEMTVYIVGAVVALLGLTLFARLLQDAGDRTYANLGLVLVLLGTGTLIVLSAAQMTIHLGFAQQTAKDGNISQLYAPFAQWEQALLDVYDALMYVGLIAYGAGIVATRQVPRWLGWACVVLGPVGLVLLAFGSDAGGDTPGVPYVLFLVVGFFLLSRGKRAMASALPESVRAASRAALSRLEMF